MYNLSLSMDGTMTLQTVRDSCGTNCYLHEQHQIFINREPCTLTFTPIGIEEYTIHLP